MAVTRYFAIQCLVCNDVVISRARHDFNTCSCKEYVFIDGESVVQKDDRGYYRIGYHHDQFKTFYVDLPITRSEAYQDWNKYVDKWKKIDISKYPPIEIPKVETASEPVDVESEINAVMAQDK